MFMLTDHCILDNIDCRNIIRYLNLYLL